MWKKPRSSTKFLSKMFELHTLKNSKHLTCFNRESMNSWILFLDSWIYYHKFCHVYDILKIICTLSHVQSSIERGLFSINREHLQNLQSLINCTSYSKYNNGNLMDSNYHNNYHNMFSGLVKGLVMWDFI